jgi:hypothetical protein
MGVAALSEPTPPRSGTAVPQPGRVLPPYGGIKNCAADICKDPPLNEEKGAYMYKDLETGKLVIFCGDCARHVELNHRERFLLVPL